jgi:UTP--glucose-1-phosphate uridylyltransferase
MKVRKAVITAAARGQHALPLQTLVDRDGVQKSALKIILEEALSTGVETICLVVSPGDQFTYASAAADLSGRLHFVEQHEPLGYGHALHCARDYVGNDSFLHLVSDHLYVSRQKLRCARQLVQAAEVHGCSVSGVQPTRENLLTMYGTVGGRRVPSENHLYEVENVVEKPTPTEAEQSLIVPGLRAGYYLCFFGMHVLTPTVMELLAQGRGGPAGGEIGATVAGPEPTGGQRAIYGTGSAGFALQHRRAVWIAVRAAGAGIGRG